MPKLLLLLALLSTATACRKSNEEPTIDFGPNNGFTTRDNRNLPAGQNDPTDWTRDEIWSTTEQQLFSNLNLALTGTQLPVDTWRVSCWPNPALLAGEGFACGINSYSSTTLPAGTVRMRSVLVDAHSKLLATYDTDISRGGNTFMPMLDPTAFSADALYRMYYVIYSPGQQVYYKGHGDIKLNN